MSLKSAVIAVSALAAFLAVLLLMPADPFAKPLLLFAIALFGGGWFLQVRAQG